ncbi:hypothetical protein CGCSCA4_v009125 [Colletotrichum siamense]|uniref:Uncharacterized protein n=1 Tax=Colletotrichum siamense TaxID=690259 RepID=A0A9P5BT89_COLSI|nr:hypothetical protein CGCSCA4_v009125 [Colletotrichum siamense]KAF4847157.1 hypothetical protein CGCSCA2_v012808 [Colletotrichum siamense]
MLEGPVYLRQHLAGARTKQREIRAISTPAIAQIALRLRREHGNYHGDASSVSRDYAIVNSRLLLSDWTKFRMSSTRRTHGGRHSWEGSLYQGQIESESLRKIDSVSA